MSPRIGLDLPTLLQTAAELADEQGLESVTLASLAQKLQIRSPSLYNHVNGLPDLRRRLAFRGLELLKERIETALNGRSGEEAIRAFSRAYLGFAREHPGLYEATQKAPDAGDEALGEAMGEVVGYAVKVLAGYGLEGDEAIHAVRTIRSLLHGFASLERQGGFGMPQDLDATFRFMVETYTAGIQAMRDGRNGS